MSPLEYLRLQLRLEGKEVVYRNLLRQVEIVPDEDMPLIVIAQLADQALVFYFDESLQVRFRETLEKETYKISFPDIHPLTAFLKKSNITFEVGHYKTYLFPAKYSAFKDETLGCFSRHDPRIQEFGFDGFAEQVYGIERDGKIVSACVSTRENDFCGEAWVYTDPAYRHQGLAQKVVRAWAANLLMAGKVPFYSHRIENTASAAFAEKLVLQMVFEEITIAVI